MHKYERGNRLTKGCQKQKIWIQYWNLIVQISDERDETKWDFASEKT